MYRGLAHFLKVASQDDNVTMVAFTGNGDFYTSGNDFGALMKGDPDDSSDEDPNTKAIRTVRNFIDELIDFPKPIIGVVNGNAIGVGVTTLGLFDAVYAVDKAWFQTPFTLLGMCPEGCSSFTFPRLMGSLKASEMLLFNKKITTVEAEKLGLVTEVIPSSSFDNVVWPRLKEMSELPPLSLKYGKQLSRDIDRDILHKVNHAECDRLIMLNGTDQTKEALFNYFTRGRSNKDSKL